MNLRSQRASAEVLRQARDEHKHLSHQGGELRALNIQGYVNPHETFRNRLVFGPIRAEFFHLNMPHPFHPFRILRTAFLILVFAGTALSADSGWKVVSTREISTASPLVTHAQKRLQSDRSVTLDLVTFDARRCTFRVVDQPGTEGNLGAAMTRTDALAGINASFFHDDRRPLGLVISDGKKIHDFERAKLLSGVLMVSHGAPSLLRSSRFDLKAAPSEAIQSGPFLVDGGSAIRGLDTGKRAARSFVVTDGKHRWAIGTLRHVTLAEAAQILADRTLVPELPIERALNLDGGSSTGLWVTGKPDPFYQREFSVVRNYLAIVPR